MWDSVITSIIIIICKIKMWFKLQQQPVSMPIFALLHILLLILLLSLHVHLTVWYSHDPHNPTEQFLIWTDLSRSRFTLYVAATRRTRNWCNTLVKHTQRLTILLLSNLCKCTKTYIIRSDPFNWPVHFPSQFKCLKKKCPVRIYKYIL